ncbi:MAG: PilX N-terminal domain-containing pilus assembly protein [Alcanivorax sp.]|nr:PilX N-terminal domain-containing pilus assembly protein [Alcanivorax sp.]
MNKIKMTERRYLPEKQQGAALVIGLILLLIMTLLGITAMRGTTLQERMSGALKDKDIALQAAESALRDGEQQVETVVAPDFSVAGWYDSGDGVTRPDWKNNPDDPAETGDGGVIDYSGSIQWKHAPQYYIERLPAVTEDGASGSMALGDGSAKEEYSFFRVVARGFGNNGNTVTVLESTYRR